MLYPLVLPWVLSTSAPWAFFPIGSDVEMVGSYGETVAKMVVVIVVT